ncbi:MAG: hypothetical protein AUG50_03370 [Betaproteobacteria bacterium 13_1_20CM_3_63_8]|nr:MAG: hypothetical protein AUG50_03370 [Betaproteobacteria bacterium 13_1_20CM_3_63_8]
MSLDPAYPTPIAAPPRIGVSGAGEFARGIGQYWGHHTSVMASASGQQIDIAASVRAAYQFARDNARLAVNLALVPFAIVVGAEFLAWLVGGGGWFGMILALLIQAGGFAVFGTVFIVRWHRFVLLGETATQSLFPPGWGTFFLTTIKVGLAFLVGTFVLGMIAAVPPHFLTGLIAFVGFVAMGFAWARLSLVFPAAAIERPMTLREGWDVMAGNYWRLFACILGCYLPFGIVHYVVDKIGGAAPSILWIVFQAVALAVSFAGVAVVAAMLSEVYRGFYPPEPQAAERRAS